MNRIKTANSSQTTAAPSSLSEHDLEAVTHALQTASLMRNTLRHMPTLKSGQKEKNPLSNEMSNCFSWNVDVAGNMPIINDLVGQVTAKLYISDKNKSDANRSGVSLAFSLKYGKFNGAVEAVWTGLFNHDSGKFDLEHRI